MPFVKLDCGILNSTLWFERDCREVFLTALLMAEPVELREAMPQIQVRSLDPTGWEVPPGWYGLAPAAGLGIIDRAKVEREAGLLALEQLGSPEQASRSQEFDGRRLVRVDGGYIVLNYMKYRERDYTSAERSKRYRMRLAEAASRRDVSKSRRDITQAEAEAEAEAEIRSREKKDQEPKIKTPARSRALTVPYSMDFLQFWDAYPKKTGKGEAWKAWQKAGVPLVVVLGALAWQNESEQWNRDGGRYRPNPSTYLNQRRWEDEAPAPVIPVMHKGKGAKNAEVWDVVGERLETVREERTRRANEATAGPQVALNRPAGDRGR